MSARPPWEQHPVMYWGLVFGIISFLAASVSIVAQALDLERLLGASLGVLGVTWVLGVICLLFSKRHL